MTTPFRQYCVPSQGRVRREAPGSQQASRRTAFRTRRFGIFDPVTVRLEGLLREAFPDARDVSVTDRTGGGDHFQVRVVSPRFEGLSLVDQHRLVYDALAEPLRDGTIHELRIETRGA